MSDIPLPLEDIEFAQNPEPRCPVVLVLDRSGSMIGQPMEELNEGLRIFAEEIKQDTLAALRVEVAVVIFGPVRVLDVHGGTSQEISADASLAFITANEFEPPVIKLGGDTPMGEAVETALALLRDRKEIYKANGVDYFRPWMFLVTDGAPNPGSNWMEAAEHVKQEEVRKGVIFYGVGVQRANLKNLACFSDQRPPVRLKGLAFRDLFQWLSKSLSAVAQSKPGDQVALPPVNWGSIDTST